MTTPQGTMDEGVEKFKPVAHDLEVLGRSAEAKGRDGSAEEIEGVVLTTGELEILAVYYYDEMVGPDYYFAWSGQTHGEKLAFFAAGRLRMIRDALGEKRFEAAVASTREDWEQKYAELEAEEKGLAPCKRCGGKRTLRDEANSPRGWCCKCENGFSEEEFAKRCEQVFGLDESGDV